MANIFLDNIYLTLILPLWIFLIIMVGRFFSIYVNKTVIYILTLISSAYGAILSIGAFLKLSPDKILDIEIPFLKINDFIINCGLHVDKTSLIFSFVLFIIALLVQIFSISYMKDEKKSYRFFALLNLFNFSMAGLFFSPNLFQTYFFWEFAGLVSYLLIGFDYKNILKSLAAKKVFIINRIGDTALIGGIILCSYFIYAYAPNKNLVTLSFVDMNTISTIIYAYASTPIFEIICSLFILGALVKTAQFPFYTWLQDAMEAKLPVSALLHSATLVAAGVFIILRTISFYTLEPILLKTIAIFGILTAIICSISACAQSHPKKVLAYSTSAQFGLIFFAIGLLNLRAAFALFVSHAFIKSLLFITLPKNNEPLNYIKFIAFLLSGLSLSGLIFSGLIAKEMLATNIGNFTTIIISAISFLTAFYIIRIALRIFDEHGIEKKVPNICELLPIIGLIFLNIVTYIFLHKTSSYKIAEPFWAALTAWICVYILYIKNAFWKIPILYPLAYNGFYLDKFYTQICAKSYEKFANLSNLIDTKVFSNPKPIITTANFWVKLIYFIEEKFFNGTVNLIVNTFKKLSQFNKKIQTRNVQHYNLYAFLIMTILITCLILGYTAMLIYLGGING